MKRKNTVSQYWKNIIGFDSNEELLIYQYLCGTIKRRKIRKLDETKRFREYKVWRHHVENFLTDCDNDKLIEFYHYIRFNTRLCNDFMDMYTHFAMPFIVSISAGVFLNSALSKNTFNQRFPFLEQILIIIIYCIITFFFFIMITYFFIHFFKDYIISNNETAFWKDCLEIIETEIKRRKEKGPKYSN